MIRHDFIWGEDRTAQLKNLVNRNQRYEQDMAEGLARAIEDSDQVMGVLRGLVANAMTDMRRLVFLAGDYGKKAFEAALRKDAINYAWVREKYGIPGPSRLDAKARGRCLARHADVFFDFLSSNGGANAFGLGVFECADLIRFYGEVLEALEKEVPKAYHPQAVAANLVKRSKQYQLGPRVQWDKSRAGERGRTLGRIGVDQQGLHVDDMGRIAAPERKNGETDEDYEERLVEHVTLVSAFIARRTGTEEAIARMRGGASLWVQTPADRIAKIDKVFGLAHAATISGTTTDHAFFYNRMSLVDRYLGQDVTHRRRDVADDYLDRYFGRAARAVAPANVVVRNQIIDPVFYIIPLGAIVGAGHHSTVECAAPLCLNGVIDYTVGRYSTLMPARGKRQAVDASSVQAYLASHRMPKRVLIYYGADHKPLGYIEFGNPVGDRDNLARDGQVWDELARVDQGLLDRFGSFVEFPNRDNVASLHPEVARLLGAEHREGLGTREQKARFKSAREEWERRSRNA